MKLENEISFGLGRYVRPGVKMTDPNHLERRERIRKMTPEDADKLDSYILEKFSTEKTVEFAQILINILPKDYLSFHNTIQKACDEVLRSINDFETLKNKSIHSKRDIRWLETFQHSIPLHLGEILEFAIENGVVLEGVEFPLPEEFNVDKEFAKMLQKAKKAKNEKVLKFANNEFLGIFDDMPLDMDSAVTPSREGNGQ